MNLKEISRANRNSCKVFIVCVTSFMFYLSIQHTQAISEIYPSNGSNHLYSIEAVPNIIGGIRSALGSFPYQVSIQQNINLGENICGGCIINKKWVVTAAHCVFHLQTVIHYVVIAVALTHLHGKRISYYPIEDYIIHTEFSFQKFTNDIAMIRVKSEFRIYLYLRAIKQTIFAPKPKKICLISGWGSTDKEGITYPDLFMVTDLMVQENSTCLKTFPEFNTTTQMCAAEEGHDVGYLDSGSPLVCDGFLFGILSYGLKKCDKGCPAVFTSIYYYRDWISKINNSMSTHRTYVDDSGARIILQFKENNILILICNLLNCLTCLGFKKEIIKF